MGKIKKILENELTGGTQSTEIYPVTSIKAVYDENNERLDNIIDRKDNEIKEELKAEVARATNAESNLRETINNITEVNENATSANIVTIDTIPNTSSSNVQQALNELYEVKTDKTEVERLDKTDNKIKEELAAETIRAKAAEKANAQKIANTFYKATELISISESKPLDLNKLSSGTSYAVTGGGLDYILNKPDDLDNDLIIVTTSKMKNRETIAAGSFQTIISFNGGYWVRIYWSVSWRPWIRLDSITKLPDGVVTTAKIIDGAVTGNKITKGTITEDNIKDKSLSQNVLADNAVNTNIIQDAAVTTEKLSINLQKEIDITNNNMPITLIESILFIGDSVTHGDNELYKNGEKIFGKVDYNLSYPTMLKRKCNWLTINNKALSGYNIQQAESIILPKCDCQESMCVIELGWNLRGGEGQYNTFYDTYDTDVAPYSDYNDYADTNMGIYCKMIEEIKEKNPNIIICLICSQGWGADNINRTAAVHRIATEYNLPIIDFNDSNLYPVNYRQNSNGAHSTIWGYALKAEYFIKGLGIALRDHNFNVAELIYKQKGLLT